MELFIQFLRFGSSKKLSFNQIDESIDLAFIIVGLLIIGGYLLSYFIFGFMDKIKNIEIREIVCDLGKFGLGLVITGHIAFLVLYRILDVVYSVTKERDNYFHLLSIAVMVFYVYICNKKLSTVSFKV